jgi:hypothetical protein
MLLLSDTTPLSGCSTGRINSAAHTDLPSVPVDCRVCVVSNRQAASSPSLKHSLASHLVAGNVNLALVKQTLGHRAISSTMVYVGTSDSQASEAAAEAMMAMY